MRVKITMIAMTAVAVLLGGCETEKQGSFGENYVGNSYTGGGVASVRPEGSEPEGGGGSRGGRRRR